MSAISDQIYSRYLDSRTKRCFDILVCAILFFPSLVLMGFLALIVLIRDGRPVFFVHRRVGRDGELFWMPKLRTLRTDADPYKPSSSSDNSLLITATGKFLRRHRLDELPQLLPVLTGHMSLVGPRPDLPHVTATIALYTGSDCLPGPAFAVCGSSWAIAGCECIRILSMTFTIYATPIFGWTSRFYL